MPTISQLPAASTVSSSDEVPISQGGAACAATVGQLLASTQPVIIIDESSLLGRTSLGAGTPEQIELGQGVALTSGALVADGLDHATFPVQGTLAVQADLVISNQGTPMLMQASLLRDLFIAGENVSIDINGVISAAAGASTSGSTEAPSSFGTLAVVTELSSQDLIPVSQSGSDCAISYGNLLNGITIDEAQAAGATGDSDTFWVAQGDNVMSCQTFSAVWVWIANQLATYKYPVVEITVDTNLNTTAHNGRLLVCSQPVTLAPLMINMGSGFQCTVFNASAGNLTLGTGFISSSGTFTLAPWQSATLWCFTYSGGTIAFAAMPSVTSPVALPGQVSLLQTSSVTSAAIAVSWQAPASGGNPTSYVVQYRVTGTAAWSSSPSIVGVTTYQLVNLLPATSYDIIVQAANSAGLGLASAVTSVVTSAASTSALPPPVVGLSASPLSSTSIMLGWTAETGSAAASSFTIQYRTTGSTAWASSVTNITGTSNSIAGLQAATSYDFEVVGVNSAGVGPASATVSASTLAASAAVTSITWNVLPSGPYAHASGAVGINAHVSPATSPIQFGFSLSVSTPPTSWTAGALVNTDLWGAYVPTPSSAGSWFAWAEGLDGSAPTVSPSPFVVQ